VMVGLALGTIIATIITAHIRNVSGQSGHRDGSAESIPRAEAAEILRCHRHVEEIEPRKRGQRGETAPQTRCDR